MNLFRSASLGVLAVMAVATACEAPDARDYLVPVPIYVPGMPPAKVITTDDAASSSGSSASSGGGGSNSPIQCAEPGRVTCARFAEERAFFASCSAFKDYCEANANGGWCPNGYVPVLRSGTLQRPPACVESWLSICDPKLTGDGKLTTFLDCCTVDDSPIPAPTCATTAECPSLQGECGTAFCTQWAPEDQTPDDGSGFCRLEPKSDGATCAGGLGTCVHALCVMPDE